MGNESYSTVNEQRRSQKSIVHFSLYDVNTKPRQELSSCSDGQPFGHNRHGPKSGWRWGPFLGGAGSPSNTMSPGRAVVYFRTKWHLDPSSHLATTDTSRKFGGCAPFSGGAGSPCNIMSLGPRPTSIPSCTLIHPTVWPQYTNVTDRTNNGPIA